MQQGNENHVIARKPCDVAISSKTEAYILKLVKSVCFWS